MNNPHPILVEAEGLMEKLDPEPGHARQVRFLARQLFQQLQQLHELDQEDLLLLEAAALLHDTGWSRAPDGSAHHKHSADLVREHRWQSLAPEQVDLVAQTARYHRKALPKATHAPFSALRPALRHKLLSMAALLRVADALDRSHESLVRSFECIYETGICRLMLQVLRKAEAEVRAVEKKRDLFELHFSTKVEAVFLMGVPESSSRMETA
jgi:exopolyphosphatase/guanosine-5'-triphosphate,3'-diphosphate pyrophosphatase